MWIIQFLCLEDDAILYARCQRMTSRTDKIPVGDSRAACMRECRKRKRLVVVIMYPDEQSYMPDDSMNIERHIKPYLLNTCVITENAKLRKIKHHKHLRQLTLHLLQLYKIIIKLRNTFKEFYWYSIWLRQ
jgi:hypothetical protein